MTGAVSLAKKEARDILRERTIVLAILVQLFVAAFSAFLAVGLLVLYDPGAVGAAPQMQVGYSGPGGFDDVLEDSPSLELVRVDRAEGIEAFQQGRIDAFVDETYSDASGTRVTTLVLPEGEVRTSLLVTELKTALDDYERQLREDRADRLEQDVTYAETDASPTVSFTFAYSILLPLLVATPVFLSGAITADSLSDEINEDTLTLLRSTPLSAGEIVLGKMLTPVLLVPAQIAVWLGLLWFNGIPVANLPILLLFATAMGAILAGCGTLVAVVAQREGPTQAAYTLLVLALALLSVMLPQDPANLVARASVGMLDGTSYAMLGLYVATAAAVLGIAVHIVGDRMRDDRLTPGAG